MNYRGDLQQLGDVKTALCDTNTCWQKEKVCFTGLRLYFTITITHQFVLLSSVLLRVHSTWRFHTRQRLRWKLTWATILTAWVSLLHMKDVSSTSVLLGNRQELALFYANDFSFSSVIKTTHGVIYSSFCIDSHYDETDIVFLTSGRWEMRNSVDSNDSALVSSSL